MSEGGGEALGPPYLTSGGFHTSQPPTPSSTVPDSGDPKTSSSGLPPFSSFTATELVTEGLAARLGPEGYGTETYTTGRILDFPSWGYFEEGLPGRLMDRGDGVPMLIPQTQYTRPWESKPIETITQDGFTKTYEYPMSPVSKLPSFQSQFNAFPDQNGETISLTTLTPAPPSPTANNSGLPSFHTLSTVTVNPRGYPLVPAPVQPREIPHIQQQFIDERHIQLFQSPATLNNAQYHQLSLSSANGPGIIQGNFVTHPQPPQQAALLAVVKTEPVAIVTTPLHQQPTIYQNSNTTMEHEPIKLEENTSTPRIIQDSRKKERRKIRASSLENSESDGVGSSSVESSGQVAAISSTANFKSPLIHQNMNPMGNVSINSQHSEMEECENGTGEKQTKKKRKRCGECIGCQRKDNCGECAPCRNDKSHQICKMRRCEKLTDKKHLLYLQNDFTRTESRRGRGKGTRASYRNKGGRGANNTNQNQGPTTPQQTSTSGAVTPQPATTHPQTGSAILTLNGNDQSPNPNMISTTDQSPGSVMPFYGSNISAGNVTENAASFPAGVREHRFPNAVWQQTSVPTDAASMGTWPQGQFIQQLPPPQIEDIRYHPQFPNAAVTVASYTQPAAAYQPTQNTFLQSNGPAYNTSHPPAASPLMNGGNTPRANTTVNGGIEYVNASPRPTEYMNGAYPGQDNLVSQPPSTPNSRCSSVQNMDNNTNDSGSAIIAPSKTPTTVNNYVQPIGTPSQGTNPGNAMPGYPPQQPPQSQQSLHNSSGYPGQNSQSVTRRYAGEELKSPFSGIVNDEKSATPNKEWSSPEQQQDSNNKPANSSWTSSVSMANGEKLNPSVYQTTDGGAGNYRSEDRANVNNKLKTMILNKQHANQNQNHFSQNQTYQNQDGQYTQPMPQHHQNAQFCTPTPPPASPVQTQPHHVTQSSPLSSQHFPFGSQNCSGQSGQQQAQYQQPLQSPQQQQQQQQQQQLKSPELQLHQHQQQQLHQQNQQFQQQMHQLQQQQQHEQQHQQLKHQLQGQNHPMQQQQQHMEQQQQQMNHQYQQQHLQQQQQLQQQQLQHQHLQQQSQLQKQVPSPNSYYDSGSRRSSVDNELMSPSRHENGTQQPYQQMQQKQYIENFANKASISNNFLVQGHHPRNLATEGGGYWGHSPTNERNSTYAEDRKQNTNGYSYPDQYRIENPAPRAGAKEHQFKDKSNGDGIEKMDSKNVTRRNECIWRKHERSGNMNATQPERYVKAEVQEQTKPDNEFSVPRILGESSDKVTFSNQNTKWESRKDTLCEGSQDMKFKNEIERLKNNIKTEVPICDCFPLDKIPSEPGSYYTHLGAAASLRELREDLENRTGFKGSAIRIEKILYTGKEGKTAQGCPMAKWVIRRASTKEKILIVVKHRLGHRCSTAWIVVILVAWEGVPQDDADQLYSMLVHKLNKFGLPTLRRCATNESRTCACQGLNPESCGASFSFGCSWSMYYNGCKYARSKNVRKFRLSVKTEEQEVEDRLNKLATLVAPLYQKMAPEAYNNMTSFETQASECRLGVSEGRPFSGVTACVDFCAHSHRDMHNMNNGLTCVVNLTKHRDLSKPEDEQLHVLPLYTIDDTDEFDDAENQANKIKSGSIEVLTKFPSEVRVRNVPLQPCRRHNKGKRKESDSESCSSRSLSRISPAVDGRISRASPIGSDVSHGFEGVDSQLQSSQVSSTVLDSPGFRGWKYPYQSGWRNVDNDADSTTLKRSQASESGNHFTFPHSSPNMNLPRTSTSSRISTSTSQFSSPSAMSDEWSMISNSDSFDFSSPHLGSPYMGSRTPSNRTPAPKSPAARSNLQSPSVDSIQSPNRGFTIPYRDGISVNYHRSTTKAKRNLLNELNEDKCEVKKSNNDKVSIGINTPDSFGSRFEDKGTSVDASAFSSPLPTLPHHSVVWPGVFDIIKPTDIHSSLINLNSPFLPPFSHHSFSTSSAANLPPNRSSIDLLQPGYIKRDEQTSGPSYQSPSPNNHQVPRWDPHNSTQSPFLPVVPESPNPESLGELIEISDNDECFKDKQMGGVAISMGHGAVLFECAKHELHSTTALRNPNRHDPSRISLVFYQHRNLNRSKHGWEEWEEKIRLKKLALLPAAPSSTASPAPPSSSPNGDTPDAVSLVPNVSKSSIESSQFTLHANSFPTLTGAWTALFPMHPCVMSGPFKDKQLTDVR